MIQFPSKGLVCGCDESGRGALAGPVVASAVILPNNFDCPKINDSKKLSFKIREELSYKIKKESLFWSVGIVDCIEIDKINILNASIKAMHLAIETIQKKNTTIKIGLLLIDGNKFYNYQSIPHRCIIRGDAKYKSIAAASIIAKTCRDKLMQKLAIKNTCYNWENNKGYPTKKHKIAIKKHGITKHHRKSFTLL
tara:strand:- start:175 stop:759 length:585 start_codon:yes stop_codon:yes gene_type:complete